MIFYSNILDQKPNDFGEVIKYLFSTADDEITDDKKEYLSLEEYLSFFTSRNLESMNDEEKWQYGKLIQFGCAIVN